MKTKDRFSTQEEYLTYIYMNGHLNGWLGEKRRKPGRLLMEKRRKKGLTQAAQQKYMKKNKHLLTMYNTLMRLEPKLVRKDMYNFGRGVK